MTFYWHPCGICASPLSRPVPISRINRSSRAGYPGHNRKNRQAGRCGSPFTSRTFPRTPARFCGSAPAWGWKPISSSRPASRSPTAPSAGPAWTTSTRSPLPATARLRHSRTGGAPQRLKLVLLTTAAERSLPRPRLRGRPGAAVRPRKRRRAGGGACGRRRPPAHPDARRPALAQRGDGGRLVAGEALRQTAGFGAVIILPAMNLQKFLTDCSPARGASARRRQTRRPRGRCSPNCWRARRSRPASRQ